jgi:glycosyltransferase involved in cell wall biosynthesis
MRILVVSQYFWPENFRINDLVSSLAGRGHAVTVLTGLPNYPDGAVFAEFRSDPQRFAHFQGAPVVRVPMLPRGHGGLRLALNYVTFALGACLAGAWRLRGRRFDVIFVFEPSPVTVGLPAVLLRRLKRAPLAFWVLDQWPETLRAVGAVRSQRLLDAVGWLVAFIYRRCDLLLAQSRSFIPQIRRYAGPGPQVEYFPSWSDAPPVVVEQVAPAREVPPARGVFTVLFAGNIGDAQDFPAVLEAAELLRDREDIRWIVVGDGRRAGWLAQEVEHRGLGARFSLLGRFPLERMPSFFSSADALLVSLKAEPIFAMTIPGKVQAYLASGKPVLAMLDGEGAELIERSGAGLVCAAGDSAGLARNVARMADMPAAERAAIAERAQRLSATEFDRDALIERLEGRLAVLRA